MSAVLANPAVTCTVLPAQRTQLLLAVWDGKASARPGGTADTVRRYLEVRSRFVYWIPTQRSDAVDRASKGPTYLTGVGDTFQEHGEAMPHALEQQLRSVHLRARL